MLEAEFRADPLLYILLTWLISYKNICIWLYKKNSDEIKYAYLKKRLQN